MDVLAGIVQFDCHIGRRKTNLFNTQERLHKEIVGSSSSHASLNCSAISEVVNPFYVKQNSFHYFNFFNCYKFRLLNIHFNLC